VRSNPERDWQDSALLLTMIENPLVMARILTVKDRKRLRKLRPLEDRSHRGWATLTDADYRRGTAALGFLVKDSPRSEVLAIPELGA
jgi:hypothetical protein